MKKPAQDPKSPQKDEDSKDAQKSAEAAFPKPEIKIIEIDINRVVYAHDTT